MAAVNGLAEQLLQLQQLGALAAVIFHEERRMAADLAQPRQPGQDLDAASVETVILNALPGLVPQPLQVSQVELLLLPGQLREKTVLDFRGQLGEHLFFQPAQDKGAHLRRQRYGAVFRYLWFNLCSRAAVFLHKCFL